MSCFLQMSWTDKIFCLNNVQSWGNDPHFPLFAQGHIVGSSRWGSTHEVLLNPYFSLTKEAYKICCHGELSQVVITDIIPRTSFIYTYTFNPTQIDCPASLSQVCVRVLSLHTYGRTLIYCPTSSSQTWVFYTADRGGGGTLLRLFRQCPIFTSIDR
jgi:hypothetical protein